MIGLLREEKAAWFRQMEYPAGDWYSLLWWMLYEKLSRSFVARVGLRFPVPPGATVWALNRGCEETAIREIWVWDGVAANYLGNFDGVSCEHPPVPAEFE